jgi:5-methylcytosine-specific restriction endonuclease McrA
VHRVKPFTIRLVDREQKDSVLQPVRVKVDPGSKVTGIALVRESETTDPETGEVKREAAVLSLIELEHRGQQIKNAMESRASLRRGRRSRNLRYRKPRFDNRAKPEGWLAPSLRHRVETAMTWVSRLSRWAPVTAASIELVKFDLHKMENPEVAGVQYQRGTLFGFEVREYVLEKWGHKCAYCDATDCPLNLDHVVSRSLGGSDRVTNLVLACIPCNLAKAERSLREFVKDELRRARIEAQLRAPLKDAAAVNSTRWALFQALKATGLPVECGSGGHTKWNRAQLGIPKSHALDAACVGRIDALEGSSKPTLEVKATGRGAYCRTRTDASGFPRGYLMRAKSVRGFRTGDMARAVVPSGKKTGTHTGRIAVRATGSFNIQTKEIVLQGISAEHFALIQRCDGYSYQHGSGASSPASRHGVSAPGTR